MTADPTAWVDDRLVAAGRRRTGPLTVVKDRPWGAVWSVATDAGTAWVKRPGELLRFEIALLSALARLAPRRTPEVLAADDDLVLLADAGTAFRDTYGKAIVAPLTAALAEVGALQRDAAALVPALLAAGVADLRPTALPGRFDELADAFGGLPGVADARARLVDLAAELATSAVPASVDHNDLHDGNLARDAGGRAVVIDWGDAVVAHPFATLLVPSRVLADHAGDDPNAPWDSPVVTAARARYLAGFAPLAPDEDLERTARLAFVTAHLGRSWTWRRAMTTFDPATVIGDRTAAEFAEGAREWFALAVRVLTQNPVGGGQ